jgi:hypothetical protein
MKRVICQADRVRREKRREIYKLVIGAFVFFAALIALCSIKMK